MSDPPPWHRLRARNAAAARWRSTRRHEPVLHRLGMLDSFTQRKNVTVNLNTPRRE
jgi:hypothetical protein